MKAKRKLITTEEYHKLMTAGKTLPEETLVRCGVLPKVKVIDESELTVEFTISDDSVDRDQERERRCVHHDGGVLVRLG